MIKLYLFLYFAFAIDSLSTVFGKLASAHPTMSLPFLMWYAADVAALGIFAILWQQILKKMPLSIAYSSRPIVTILGVFYGVFIFGDKLSPTAILGILIILVGIWLVTAEPKEKDPSDSLSPAECSAALQTKEVSRE